MEPTIKNILDRVPGFSQARDIQAERIAGLTNSNYRIIVDGECFVLRVSGQNTARLGIDREKEVAALRSAAAAGIGPEVVAFLPPEGHLVTRWIDGRHWSAEEFRTQEHVRLLIKTVKRLHALPLTGAAFSPFRRVESYIETARGFGVPLPNDFAACLETMKAVEADQQRDTSDWRHFCHNDLVSVNYLYCEKENVVRVLDWEFAGLGDIYYDLASVVYTHDNVGPIPTNLEDVMLACYFDEVTGGQRRRLQGMKYMLMLFSGMWGLAQHGMVLGGLIPPIEEFDYLEFSQYLFTHDIQVLRSTL